jgi:hypothetical protein
MTACFAFRDRNTFARALSRAAGALLAVTSLGALTLHAQAPNDPYAGDPPNRVARIAWAQGNVSLEPSGTEFFGGAEVNYPLTNGDRLYADLAALSELQTSGLAVRLGNGADLTITRLDDTTAQFALAQGSVRLRARDLYAPPDPYGNPQQAVDEVDTPNTTVDVIQTGDIRVDFYPMDSTTVVTVNSGAVAVSGPGFSQQVFSGQALRMSGFSNIYPEYVQILPPDELDQFDSRREQVRNNSIAIRNHYVDPGMIGVADLDQYGDWTPTPQYGPVWFPRTVAFGWTPYSIGHWANVAPWGYTWVDSQPWGFAPFHYGRWNNFGGRWGWVPGPPPSVFAGPAWGGPPPRPVYSPALVAFVGGGGGGFSLSLSIGGHAGVGVTAWFPLGPSEPYVPWYHTSPAYVNRVNVTNIYTNNVTEIHNTYINKVTVYNVTNVTYVNRTVATVAVSQNDFAAGHTVAQSQPIKLDDNARRQLTAAPVLARAVAPPPKSSAPPQVAARAVPASVSRPVVQTKQGFQRAGAPPAAAPLKAPTPPPATAASRAAMPQRPQAQSLGTAKPNSTGPPGAPATPQQAKGAARPTPAESPAAVHPATPAPATAAKPAVIEPKPAAPVVRPAVKPAVIEPKPATPATAHPAPLNKPVIPPPVPPAVIVPAKPATAVKPVVVPAKPVPPVKGVPPPKTDKQKEDDKRKEKPVPPPQ